MSWVGKFYGYKALRTHPTPFILFSFLKRLSLWTDITCFWRTNIDTNTLHIFCMMFWMNTKCNSRCWLKTFCISKRKSWGCGILFPAHISTWKNGHKCTFFYPSIVLTLLELQLMFLIFHDQVWMEGRIIHVQSWNYYAVRRQKFFQGLLIKLLLPLFAEWAVLPVWASTINSYLFSRPTISSLFVFTRLNVKVICFPWQHNENM